MPNPQGGQQKSKPVRVQVTTHHPDATRALQERCRARPAFRRLLEAAALDLVRRGRPPPVLDGNSLRATRALRALVETLSQQHRAQLPNGQPYAWCYLTHQKHKGPRGTYRVLAQIPRKEALRILQAEPTLDGFKVRTLLGYASTLTRQEAARLERLHRPPDLHLVEEATERHDTAFDLDPNENEHFRDDRGTYDEAGVLQPLKRVEKRSWEEAFSRRHEAWNRDRDPTTPTRSIFYPAPAAQALRVGRRRVWHVDHHGIATLLRYRDERAARESALAALKQRRSFGPRVPSTPRYHASPNVKGTQDKMECEVARERRAQLDADDAEVGAHALTDVPYTILELLERQVEATPGKAPRGLIAAIARERLNAQERAEQHRRFTLGLAALARAATGPPAHPTC